MAEESGRDQIAGDDETVGQTAMLVESLMAGSPDRTIGECGPDILASLKGSGLEIDAASAKGKPS